MIEDYSHLLNEAPSAICHDNLWYFYFEEMVQYNTSEEKFYRVVFENDKLYFECDDGCLQDYEFLDSDFDGNEKYLSFVYSKLEESFS